MFRHNVELPNRQDFPGLAGISIGKMSSNGPKTLRRPLFAEPYLANPSSVPCKYKTLRERVVQAFLRYQERRNPTSGARSNTHVKTGRRDKALLKIPELSHRRCHTCAQSLPDSQQVDPQAQARWKEDTFMHDVELSDRQDFTGSSRNPDRKNVLQRTKNTPVAPVRRTISHKPKLGFLRIWNLAKVGSASFPTVPRMSKSDIGS